MWLFSIMMLLGAGSAGAAEALTSTLEVPGYVKSHFIDFVNKDYDGTALTSFNDLPGLGVTAQNTVGESYGGNNWYNWNGNLRLQSGGGRWIQFTLDIKADDYVIINGGAANEAYEVSMTDGDATIIANASEYVCFKANKDMDALKLTLHRYNYLSQILIMTKDATAITAEYTINYLLNGEGSPVKTVNGESAVGGSVVTDASFFVDDVKYFRADGEPESFTIAASGNTFNVNVRLAATYNYSLSDNFGATVTSGSGLEGEKVYVPYPRYLLKDGKFYEAAVTNKEYRKSLTLSENNISATAEYTLKDGVNAVFFVEGEKIEGMTENTAGNIPVRASNAMGGVSTEDLTITTLPAGKYKFHAGIFTSKSSYGENTVNFGIGEQTFAAGFTGVNLNEIASDEFTLNAATEIKYLGTTSWADAQLDYIWVEKTGDVEVAEKTYTVAGAPASLFGAEWDPSNTAGDMTLNTETGLYEWSKADATLPAGKVEFKVVVSHAWDEAYPGSNYELAIAEDGKYDVAITFNAETKEVTATATKKGEAVIEKTYTIAGTENLFGTNWDTTDTNNDMVLNAETGLYEWSKTDVALSGNAEFKIVMNHAWGNEWPSSNYVLTISEEGTYDVVITFNAETKEINATATKKGETPVLNTYTATFTTNAGWGEVYAYAWTSEDGNTTEFLGAWPGTKLEDNEGVYTVTIEAAAAPANIIFNNGGLGAQTEDLVFEDGKAYEFKISDEWAAAIAAAAAEAEEDGVAVGKLIEAIAKAQGQTGTDEEKAALQAAVDQYKADNAPQETDLTSQFSALTDWQKWTGATGYTATNYCPTVDINDGTKKQVCEKYETTCATTGDIFYQTVTGLTTGTYKIELYGGAAFTFGRGFGSMAFTGEIGTGDAWGTHNSDTYTAGQHIDTETGVKMYAITSEGTYEEEIPIYYATNFPDGAATVVLDGVKVGVNGEVKIGMNKTSQSTNWHVVQLKGVTAQVLAKDLYAAHQTELQALVAEAQALAADENKTEGKEAFQEALTTAELAVNSQWYNNTEIEQIINNLKNAIANFKKANYYIDFAAGEYYVIDAESGKMMAAGSSYGTRGIVNETGLDLYLTPYTESRTVTFDSRVANNENDHFLGINLYMDSSSWGWALEYQGFGFYIKDPDGGKYINLDENDNLVLSDTPREFIIVTKDGVMEERMEELADATETNPVDATFLLQNPNFNRNDQRVSAWEWIPSETAEENADNWNNHNFNGGNQVNNCAESYHAAFVVKQTVSGAPAGKYTMTAQGFYRQDAFEGDAPAAPMFFANGVNKDVPAKTGEENSMSKASESFTSGLYTIEPIEFEVAEDGMIYVGVTAAVHNQWVIFDNFQLKYYGKKDITDGISVIETEVLNGNVYNLQGQKVTKAQKGLFIVNGKKVVKK